LRRTGVFAEAELPIHSVNDSNLTLASSSAPGAGWVTPPITAIGAWGLWEHHDHEGPVVSRRHDIRTEARRCCGGQDLGAASPSHRRLGLAVLVSFIPLPRPARAQVSRASPLTSGGRTRR
jgi:hypothetical protein